MFPVLENFDEIVDIDIAYAAGDFINRQVGGDKQFFGFRDALKARDRAWLLMKAALAAS